LFSSRHLGKLIIYYDKKSLTATNDSSFKLEISVEVDIRDNNCHFLGIHDFYDFQQVFQLTGTAPINNTVSNVDRVNTTRHVTSMSFLLHV
jgi:hypothetical protein